MSTPYVGEIRMFGFPRVPVGWHPCDGSLLSIPQYDTLFHIIGTTYGGDGQNTFAVPDLRGRVPMHFGNGASGISYVAGQKAGSENLTLTTQQLPRHDHPIYATQVAANTTTIGQNVQFGTVKDNTMYATNIDTLGPINTSPRATDTSGNSLPHENTMPTLTVQFFIATEGIFPSQG